MNIVKETLFESVKAWHGSARDFKFFDQDKQGPSKAFFFSNSEEHAEKFAKGEQRGKSGFVKQYDLSLKNPLSTKWTYEKGGEKKPELVKRAKAEGYDGLILDTEDLGVKIKEYIVFDTKNIIPIEEGLLGRRKPANITDGVEMNWLMDVIDEIEVEEDISRDEAISIVEDNIVLVRDLFKRKWNSYETYTELVKNNK